MVEKLVKKLDHRTSQENKRSLLLSDDLIDFVSNDYLGLSRSQELFERIKGYSTDGITNLNGSTGSRLLAGNSKQIVNLECKLAKIFQAESCLIFNSGYTANMALISTVPQRDDTIIYDSLAHVCIKEGAALSKAKTYSFKHNDAEDLAKKLSIAKGDKYVIIESVYSMDGDLANFENIIKTAKEHNAKLIVDEAHSTGMYGDIGQGLTCHLGIESNFFARIYTFGKGMGVHGACIAGPTSLVDFLVNFARPFIYTTSLPLHSIFSIDAAFDYLQENIGLQKSSEKLISYFNTYFNEKFYKHPKCNNLTSSTPIQPILISGNALVKKIANALNNKGFDVRPILSPTVPEGSERLRVSIHAYNSESEIRDLVDTLYSLL